MKVSAMFICLLVVSLCVSRSANAQSLVGTWQLVREGNCMDEVASAGNTPDSDSTEDLRGDMYSRTSATPRIVSFRENASGEESTRILNTRRTANAKKFFYKFNGEMLLILDKKSQTISDSYLVDKFTADSLILSNASRPCEIRIFVRTTQ